MHSAALFIAITALATGARSAIPTFALNGMPGSLLFAAIAVGCGALLMWSRSSRRRSGPVRAQRLDDRGRQLLEAGVIGIFICDSKGNMLEANAQFLKMIGYSAEEIDQEGYPALSAITTAESQAGLAEKLEQARATGRSWPWLQDYVRRDGGVTAALCGVARADSQPDGLVGFAIDLSGVAWTGRSLQALPGRILQLQDDERRRIARELHDTTAQNLAALSMNLTMLAGAVPGRTEEIIEECNSLTEQCLREIRMLSYELHPPLLDELGLESALRGYLDAFIKRTGIAVALDLSNGAKRPDPSVESALFRIAQQALENVQQHSGSAKAELRLSATSEGHVLIVRDYGCGISENGPASNGIGIPAMRERARQVGGRVEISRAIPGTIVRVVIPGA